jgi:1,5-anhydro-D-fructose reductase (1,5-anhydro-D-mannitol-forming)
MLGFIVPQSPNDRIGWALLGPGRHAERSVAPQMKRAAGARLAAVISRDPVRGAEFARRHGFARAYTTLAEALTDPNVDAIYDASPDGLHAANAIAAAQADKHILVEKPLAISVAEGERAIAECRRRNVVLGVVFNQRHEAAHIEARRLIASGRIGDVVSATAPLPLPRPASQEPQPPRGGNWRADPKMRPGGIASSIGDHAFDTLSYIVGRGIEEVVAFTDSAPPERFAAILLRLAGGAIGTATASFKTPFARRPIEVHGAKGSLIVEDSYAYLVGPREGPQPRITIVDENGSETLAFPPSECFRLEIERFQRAIAGDGKPMTTGEEALRAVAIVEAIYDSARSGRAVRIREVACAPQS